MSLIGQPTFGRYSLFAMPCIKSTPVLPLKRGALYEQLGALVFG